MYTMRSGRFILKRPPGSLRQRFEKFVTTLVGFESIDQLLRKSDLPGKSRADYFVLDRKIVIEQKSLEADSGGKPADFVRKLMRGRGLRADGTISTNQVFSALPDGERLNRLRKNGSLPERLIEISLD